MPYETLLIEDVAEHVVLVTLNRPEAANAFNTAMAADLAEAFLDLGDGPARCVILTGAGERAFCAGADLKERRGMDDAAWAAQHRLFEAMAEGILKAPMAVIAAVNGSAFGGGCELALACDFIYASSRSRFALPEATLGIMPGLGGTQLMPRAAGSRRAKEALMTGAPVSAREAMAWGMVNKVTAPEDLMPEVLATAARIAAAAPLSVKAVKAAVDRGAHLELKAAMALELELYETLFRTADRLEGVAAFNDKRAARFRGE